MNRRVPEVWQSMLRFLLVFGFAWFTTVATAQDLQQQFTTFQQQLAKAGAAFQKKEMANATRELQGATNLVKQMLLATKTASQRNLLKPHYERLLQAVKLVKQNGGDIGELPSWGEFVKASMAEKKDAPDMPAVNSNELSFTKDIAPILVSKCGNCHIRRSSGELSMATFESIQKGSRGVPLITPGNASASRMIEVIEDGSMPQGNNKVSPEELTTLKKWLDDGAKFDGTSLTANIANANAPANPNSPAMADDFKPPEKLTVSFARDIAPVLVESCTGCHIDAQQTRGNLNMNTFAQISGRGDPLYVRGKPADSLIVQKIRGLSGARMPMNRPALSEETIVKFETWINEGATFDGGSPDMALARVAEQAWVANATPEELKAKRLESALNDWKRVYAGKEAFSASDDTYVVLSDTSKATAERILEAAGKVSDVLAGSFGSKGKSLFPSGATIFVFDKRYDYSEFGKMAENRSLPSSWTAHWRREGVNAYVALTIGSSDDDAIERDLKVNLASLWASSFDGMPRWFADGIGAYAYAARAPRNDAYVTRLEQSAMRTIPTMKNAQPLLNNNINEEDAASIGFLAVRALNQGANKKKYDGFIKAMQKGGSFTDSFTDNYGPIDAAISGFLGIKPK